MTSTASAESGWKVMRWSGRRGDDWCGLACETEDTAHELYHRLYVNMRQGGIRLVRPDGSIVKADIAPRLRSRW